MAMGILITSPITHWASGPETIANAMPDGSDPLKVFEAIPTTWDETRVLGISDIGRVAAFARRKGTTWFLAMVNGDANNPLTENNIDLSFLGTGAYSATMLGDDVADGTDAAWNVTDVASLTSSYDLNVTMRRGGGFVAEFTLLPEPSTVAIIAVACTMLRRGRVRKP
jgi:alpha-glucosidase